MWFSRIWMLILAVAVAGVFAIALLVPRPAARSLVESNRLSLEYTRESADLPAPAEMPLPADVLIVVDSALERISRVKTHLGIVEASPEALPDPSKTPTDVFYATLAANRQVSPRFRENATPPSLPVMMLLPLLGSIHMA